MSEEKKNSGTMWLVAAVVTAAIGGIVGLTLKGSEQSARNQQNLIDNLPAVIAQLEVLQAEVDGLKKETLSGGEIESRFGSQVERVNALEGQLTRRFEEVVNRPMTIVRGDVETNEEKIEELLERVSALEAAQK